MNSYRLFPSRGARASGEATPASQRLRAFTLVEVIMASVVMSIVLAGLVAMVIQSRRLSEGSILQNSAINIVQGYLEQMKNMDYDALTESEATGTVTIATQIDESTADPLTLSNGDPPVTIPAVGTPAPSGAVDNIKSIAIKYPAVNPSDTLTLNIWIWVKDLTGTATNVTNAKSITLIYTYAFRDGGRVRQARASIRTIRSVVPSY